MGIIVKMVEHVQVKMENFIPAAAPSSSCWLQYKIATAQVYVTDVPFAFIWSFTGCSITLDKTLPEAQRTQGIESIT